MCSLVHKKRKRKLRSRYVIQFIYVIINQLRESPIKMQLNFYIKDREV